VTPFCPKVPSRPGPPGTAACEKAYKVACYVPAQIRQAYDLPALYAGGVTGRGATIVVVDSFGSPTIRNDLGVFDRTFHLPAPPSFRIIRPAGQPAAAASPSSLPAPRIRTACRASSAAAVTSGNDTVSFSQGGHEYTVRGFTARRGYDLASGVGTVNALAFVPELARLAGH
jgi:hypothetical protein